MYVREQSNCCASADALTVAGLADRRRETAARGDGRAINVRRSQLSCSFLLRRSQDSSLPLSAGYCCKSLFGRANENSWRP